MVSANRPQYLQQHCAAGFPPRRKYSYSPLDYLSRDYPALQKETTADLWSSMMAVDNRQWRFSCEAVCIQISTISKSSLRAPHSGQHQLIGTSSQRVPALMPSSGHPTNSSYISPQTRHIQVLLAAAGCGKSILGFQGLQ